LRCRGKDGISVDSADSAVRRSKVRHETAEPENGLLEPMREYLRIPTRVEVVRGQEIIASSEEGWAGLPDWARECYERGQMVIATTTVTVFNAAEALRARPSDFIVRSQDGVLSVYDEVAFHRDFVPAHATELHKLHAA